MRPILFLLAAILVVAPSCRWMGYKRIKGNGNLGSEERHINYAEKIKLAGSFNVEITQGANASVKVEADENILPYILTAEKDGYLVIRTKEHFRLSTNNPVTIYVTTPKLEHVQVSGSGNITGRNKFTEGSKLTLKISGSGNIQLEANAPDIDADITGSGSMTLKGETKTESIHISGSGDYYADELKAEDTKVRITGSGNVRVFADNNLDVNITGGGSVYYKGAAAIKQRVTGSGEIKKIE